MPQTISVHQGKSVNVGPVTVFSQFEAAGSPNNVVDNGSELTADCPSGRCRVGFLSDGRTLYVDGLSETASSASVIVRLSLATGDTILVDVLHPAAAFPPAVRIAGSDGTLIVSAEYDTPTSR